ncbi:MAG: hypothetical protein ACP5O8_02905 [Candidatus Aenigmatarchaeota archaeon]
MKKYIITPILIFLALPLAQAIMLPFELTVPQTLSADAGSTISFKVQVRNLINSKLTNLSLEVSGIADSITVSQKTFDLEPRETKEIEVNLTVPSYLEGNYKIYVKLASPQLYDIKSIDLKVQKPELPRVSVEYLIEPEAVKAGQKFSFGVGVKSEEVQPITLSINLSLPETWNYSPVQIQQEISPGETKVSYFSITPTLEEGEITAKISYSVRGKTYEIEKKSSKITPYEEEIPSPVPVGLFVLITSSPELLVAIILAIIAIIVVLVRFWTKPKKGKK